MTTQPRLGFRQIWNLCFGFMGIQFGLALQNSNASRIFQTLGASVDEIPILWIAAPLTGLLVQPLVGYFSDRTWGRFGRRGPYFLGGALFAAAALVAMPNSPLLWIAAGLLWVLDASINVSMGPLRAFVGDQLPSAQRPTGYAMQTFFIAAGSVIASVMPWLLAQVGVDNVGHAGAIPDTVKFSFYAGAITLLGAIGWTVLSTREYPPETVAEFDDANATPVPASSGADLRASGAWWALAGVALLLAVYELAIDRQLYVLGGGLFAYGLLQWSVGAGHAHGAFAQIVADLRCMSGTMRRLIVVQLFSWSALFAMWIYTTAAVTQVHFFTNDPRSIAYNDGANWVGVLFAAYNVFAALAAVVIPWMTRRLGLRLSHLINLFLGGLGLMSFLVVRDPRWLLASMAGVGFAWASILSLPYAMLSDSVPARKMGVYMGIFNLFIVIPQLLAASVLGSLLKLLFDGAPIYALLIGGISLMLAGLCTLGVR